MTEDLQLLIKYVDAATNLAESVKKDIKLGKIHTSTAIALNQFQKAAFDIAGLTDELDKRNMKLN